VYAIPRAGGAATAIYTSTDKSGFFGWQLVVDDARVYFMVMDPQGFGVLAVPKNGGPATRLGGDEQQLNGGIDQILQDEQNLFLLHAYGEVLMLPKTPQ
jgi:hypothetical protein